MSTKIYQLRKIITACLLVAFALRAQAQDATAMLRSDAAKALVGDQVRLFLEITHQPAKSDVQWPQIPDSFSASLEVVEKGKIDTLRSGGINTYRQRIVVSGFDSGLFTVPALSVQVSPKDGSPAYALLTDSIPLVIETVPVDTAKPFRGIKGIMEVQGSWLDYLWYIIAGAVLLAVMLFFTLRKKKTAPPPPVTAPAETLTARTLRLLDALEKESLWQGGAVKEYYVRLTDVVREYLEERFGIAAMEQTTDELLAIAQRHKELVFAEGELTQLLRLADMAKFAKAQPLPAEHMAGMEAARNLVRRTEPRTPPADHKAQQNQPA